MIQTAQNTPTPAVAPSERDTLVRLVEAVERCAKALEALAADAQKPTVAVSQQNADDISSFISKAFPCADGCDPRNMHASDDGAWRVCSRCERRVKIQITGALGAPVSPEGGGPEPVPASLSSESSPSDPKPLTGATPPPSPTPAAAAAPIGEQLQETLAAYEDGRAVLVRVLGADLGNRVAGLHDLSRDPDVSKAVKAVAVERLGDKGFLAARDALGVKAGECPTGAQLRRLVVETLAKTAVTSWA